MNSSSVSTALAAQQIPSNSLNTSPQNGNGIANTALSAPNNSLAAVESIKPSVIKQPSENSNLNQSLTNNGIQIKTVERKENRVKVPADVPLEYRQYFRERFDSIKWTAWYNKNVEHLSPSQLEKLSIHRAFIETKLKERHEIIYGILPDTYGCVQSADETHKNSILSFWYKTLAEEVCSTHQDFCLYAIGELMALKTESAEKAFLFFKMSAKLQNPYAQYALATRFSEKLSEEKVAELLLLAKAQGFKGFVQKSKTLT